MDDDDDSNTETGSSSSVMIHVAFANQAIQSECPFCQSRLAQIVGGRNLTRGKVNTSLACVRT